MSAYLGIDLSLSATGVAVLAEAGNIFLTIATSPREPISQRLEKIADALVVIARGHQPALIVAEAQAFAKFGVAALGEVHGAVKYAFRKAEVQVPVYVAPTTLKKFATGSGKAEKSDIKMAIFERWGVKLTDNNQADAYILARIAGALHGGLPATLEHQRECLKTIRKTESNAAALATLTNGGSK